MRMNTHGGKRPGAGRKPAGIRRTVVKAYPTPEQKEKLERLAALAGHSMSEYLIECGLTGIIIDGGIASGNAGRQTVTTTDSQYLQVHNKVPG